MSRFSRSEAESRGWFITVVEDPDTGELREVRGDLYKGPGNTISLSHTSEGKLLEAISSYEARMENTSFGPERQQVIETEAPVVPEGEAPADGGEPVNAGGDVLRDTQTPEGAYAQAELYPAREGEIEGGKLLVADPEVVKAREASAELAREAEYMRTDDPLVVADEKNVEIYDESGNVVDVRQVRAEDGGGTIREILERRDPENSQAEQDRVADSDAGHYAEGEYPPERGEPVSDEEIEEALAKAVAEGEPEVAREDEQESESDEFDATEAAVALAEEADVDLSEVEGSGKDGRVVKSDVEAALAEDEPSDD